MKFSRSVTKLFTTPLVEPEASTRAEEFTLEDLSASPVRRSVRRVGSCRRVRMLTSRLQFDSFEEERSLPSTSLSLRGSWTAPAPRS
jgi:hypothetical protein